MRRWLAVMFLTFVGCGSSSDPVAPDPTPAALVGNWLYDNGTSGAGVNLDDDGQYSIVIIQVTDVAAANVEAERGTYSATASAITFDPAQSSCPGPHPRYLSNYTVTPTSLTLSGSASATVLVRNTAAATSISATYGCFNAGVFTASPLVPVSN
jgi:hypothetical protein